MIDITSKTNTLREAIAQAIVKVSSLATIKRIEEKKVPKGDIFEMSKAAGLLGVKKTPELLPNCHPLPIEYTGVAYNIQALEIIIQVTVKTIYKTGVEVEAMHGASIVALNMYDMLKPLDKGIEIKSIKLLKKKGGKSSGENLFKKGQFKAAVIVCSDSIAKGEKEDKSGQEIVSKLKQFEVEIVDYAVIPDEIDLIQAKTKQYHSEGMDLIIFTGGTGLSPRDVTPTALRPLLDRVIPGVEEAIRSYGQDRMPYAMLSRSVAGTMGKTLVLALPGSTNGAKESMDAIFPSILHIFKILKGERHN